jgi:signal transduction histidine kinase
MQTGMLFKPNRAFWWLTGIAAVHAFATLVVPKGYATTVVGDVVPLLMCGIATLAMARNGWRAEGVVRSFWWLLALGCFFWSVNQAGWTWYETLLLRQPPDATFVDPVLFLHLVPFIAAVGLLPQLPAESRKLYFSTFNTVILTFSWLFAYAFVVVPDEFVIYNAANYNTRYNLLYLLESILLIVVLGMAISATRANWRQLYLHLFWVACLYTVSSLWINEAIGRGVYYTGGPYDVPYMVTVCWFAWIGIRGGDLQLTKDAPDSRTKTWIEFSPRLAMLAVLSLPFFGGWALLWDTGAPELRRFRLGMTMVFMVILGVCVFIKQHYMNRALLDMVAVEQRNVLQMQRLQDRLVQKEKLASLGQLVAGAAHEINNPLTAILGFSDLLATDTSLSENAQQTVHKIGQQARRTSSLVADLQSFSRTGASDRTLVDVASLVQRAAQIQSIHVEGRNIRIETDLEPSLPRIWGNANRLFQVFTHITENAIEALPEHGGSLFLRLRRAENELVLDFVDSGSGMREPQRVFDPFYTTKPVGSGTGLGLSASYGIIQEHGGEITCSNREEGGAVFTVLLPIAAERVQAAAANLVG